MKREKERETFLFRVKEPSVTLLTRMWLEQFIFSFLKPLLDGVTPAKYIWGNSDATHSVLSSFFPSSGCATLARL